MVDPTWHNIHPEFRLNGGFFGVQQLEELANNLKQEKAFKKDIGAFLLDWISNSETLNVNTSGSTGNPKTIQLKKEHMVNSALATGEYFDLKPGQKALLCLPCTGIAGKMMLVRAMVLGLQLDFVQPTSSPLSKMDKTYDFVAMVPLQVKNSLPHLQRVRKLIIGGAPVDLQLREQLNQSPVQAFETYGMTETITHIAVKPVSGNSLKYFEALPHVTVSQDKRGCLVIDAPKVTDTKIITNDLVELLSNTTFIWVGRFDSIINSGGIKLMPEKIEEKLESLISSRFFVSGLPDKILGQKLVLVIEGNPSDEQELIRTISGLKELSKYEVPKQVYFVKTFQETATKKVDRKKTLEQVI